MVFSGTPVRQHHGKTQTAVSFRKRLLAKARHAKHTLRRGMLHGGIPHSVSMAPRVHLLLTLAVSPGRLHSTTQLTRMLPAS
jgi:hypothetical protein